MRCSPLLLIAVLSACFQPPDLGEGEGDVGEGEGDFGEGEGDVGEGEGEGDVGEGEGDVGEGEGEGDVGEGEGEGDVGEGEGEGDVGEGEGEGEGEGDCGAGLVDCGSGCTDLADDEANCGACGYAVLGDRSCEGGVPTPGWAALDMTGAPTGDVLLAAWSGGHFVVVTAADGAKRFDPINGGWENAGTAPTLLGQVRNWQTAAEIKTIFVYHGSQLSMYNDDTNTWQDADMTGGPGGFASFAPTVAWDAIRQDLLVGVGGVAAWRRFDFPGGGWTTLDDTPAICQNSSSNPVQQSPGLVHGGTLILAGGTYQTGTLNSCDENLSLALGDDEAEWQVHGDIDEAGFHGLVDTAVGVVSLHGLRIASDATTTGCRRSSVVFIDPADGSFVDHTAGSANNLALGAVQGSVLWTGKALFRWGGLDANCAFSGGGAALQAGQIGVPDVDGVDWSDLPTAGQPSARIAGRFGYLNIEAGDANELWSGREVFVVGGNVPGVGNLSVATSPARYQPPVGCVCPNSLVASGQVDPCVDVTDIADANCIP